MIIGTDETATIDWGALAISKIRPYTYSVERLEVIP
jgi:hypothetical protein